MEEILERTIAEFDLFYKSENKKKVFATSSYLKCYIFKCFETQCNCEWTQHCDLEDGKTFKDVIRFHDLTEIDVEEFRKLWAECKRI